MFLLARAARVDQLYSAALAALLSVGIFLPGLNLWLTDLEPVPRAFSFGLTLLAIGCLARNKPLLSGLLAGLALIYHPVTAAPFWILALTAYAYDRSLRKLLRPMIPILVVFLLLLANLAQLQPGTPDSQPLFSRFSPHIAAIQKFRAPGFWISLWPAKLVCGYLAVFVIGVWATTRIWTALNRQTRWLFVFLPCLGLATLPLSRILLDGYRWSTALRVTPMQMLTYTVAFALLACGIAASQALKIGAKREAIVWIALCLLPVAIGIRQQPASKQDLAIFEVASWAANNTWGSSMFLFPDAGRALYPGVFRGRSARALWITYYAQLAEEWWTRWSGTMQAPLSGNGMQQMLSLPIDYFVLQRSHVLETELNGRYRRVRPVFANRRYTVYEASTLRIVPGVLHVLDVPSGTRN